MALLLHDETAGLISGAFAQSGPTIPNFVNGAMNETVPRRICAAVQAAGSTCDPSEEIQLIVDSLKRGVWTNANHLKNSMGDIS